MGLRGIAPLEWAPVLLIMRVLSGGTQLRTLGGQLGGALRGFRSVVRGAPLGRDGPTDPRRLHAPADAARFR